jgi:drug/metabolite transporter (DMT)-like permease
VVSDAIIYALLANICFSSGSILFTSYSRKFGALKFNTFKAFIALFFFASTLPFYPLEYFPDQKGIIYLALSGLIGLAIGDIFIFNAFKLLGASRTLTLFGLRPLMIAVLTFFVFSSPFKSEDIYPSYFFILCLVVFAKENQQQSKSWGLKGLLIGLLGVLMDSTGVILTRIIFDENPTMTTFHANFIRTLSAVIVLHTICFIRFKSFTTIKLTEGKKDPKLIFAPILGTFIALIFFIQAIKSGNLIIISAIGVTGPIFASTLESFIQKQKPSKYLILALILFSMGMLLRAYLIHQGASDV